MVMTIRQKVANKGTKRMGKVGRRRKRRRRKVEKRLEKTRYDIMFVIMVFRAGRVKKSETQ